VTAWSAQTIGLSVEPGAVLPSAARWWPDLVRVSAGTSLGRQGRLFVVGRDLDAARLPGEHPTWKAVKQAPHHARLPGPALTLGPDGRRLVGLYW